MVGSLAYTLIGINLLAYFMVVLRPKLYKAELYRPMLVNIKLSILPLFILIITGALFIILQAISMDFRQSSPIWWPSILIGFLGLTIWLLLLPNSGYLITELNFNHRDQDKVEVPLWYDIVGVLSLAMSGVMNMCFNIFIIQFMISVALRGLVQNISFLFNAVSWIIMILLMSLASFGIYMGRYIRFNSWDVKHPVKFLQKLRQHFIDKSMIKNCALFVLFHTLFFVLFYRATAGVILTELVSSTDTIFDTIF